MENSEISSVSLRCLRHNNCLVAASRNGLILTASSKPTKEIALWRVTYRPSSWTLVNQASAMSVTFDTKSKLVSSSDEDGSNPTNYLEVKDSDRRLLLRLSSGAAAAAHDKLSLELCVENYDDGKACPVFLVREGFDRTFRHIDRGFFSSCGTSTTSRTIAELRDNFYDYVVVGSSFCSLAFIHQILQKNPQAKILVLEKGLKYLSKHHQQCPSSSCPEEVEFRPWSICQETTQNEFLKNVYGQIPLLGGRSTYWSGWSPTPSTKELAGWPAHLSATLQQTYFALARGFLGVVEANKINAQESDRFLYRTFQSELKNCLDSAASIESVEQVLHAPLAMGNDQSIKFSTVEMLLSMKSVTVIFEVTVEKILHDGKKATALQTNQGTIFPLHGSKLILAMSTLPATTLVLNSFKTSEFPQLSNVGKRFTAHFVSSVVARVPRSNLSLAGNIPEVELGAVYIAGMKEEAQYHLQLSGVAYAQCKDGRRIHEICKKFSANSIPPECIDVSQDFVVVSCSALGELDYKNKINQFNLNSKCPCLTTNGELKFQLNNQDKELWDLMDQIIFQVMGKLSASANSDDLEYWHETDQSWRKAASPREQIRKKSLVHDASTMWIGGHGDTDAPVSMDYRLQGVDNVYITGGALWPTGGSWNPVLTIVAMAMHLADTICESARDVTAQPLFDNSVGVQYTLCKL